MLSSFLKRTRRGVTLCALLAFLHAELIWGMGAGRLIPGAPLQTESQQPAQQANPGELQQQPQQPIDTQSTTVIEVTVPKGLHLSIEVEEGEGAVNVVGKKSATRPLVTVRNEKNQLLEGAMVAFIAPADGPSVLFGNGLRTVTVMTDAKGRARVPSMRAVNAGSFKMEVAASFRGEMASIIINQTNQAGSADTAGNKPAGKQPPATAKSGMSGAMWGLILGGGAAAAVGIALGMGHKGSSGSTSTTTATIGGPGTPTVGAP